MKKCGKCKTEKPLSDFPRSKQTKDGLFGWCKQCKSAYMAQYRKGYYPAYYEEHKDEIQERARQRYAANEDGIRDRCQEREKEYRQTERGKSVRAAAHKKYAQSEKGKEVYRRVAKKWGQSPKGRESIRRRARRLYKEKKLYYTVSRGVRHCLGQGVKSKRLEELLGYTIDELRLHLERQFQDGMTWDNHGQTGWHIDHIRPVSSFDIKDENSPDFRRCWALDNLRPLWAQENLRKGAEWSTENQKEARAA